MAKPGRNQPCPCGSGKKYKRCHGSLSTIDRIMAEVPQRLARHRAKEHQRTAQQGLGRPIIAAELRDGHRIVAVNNRIFYSKKWKTFHEFLIAYLLEMLGPDWCKAELSKPLDQRHPVMLWYYKLCEQQRLFVSEPGKVASSQMTGAVAAFLHLAYNLYALDHNAELQAKLLERLRNRDNFSGARYEVQVAASLTRAGFTLVFENEDDRSTSHCEFIATYTPTGKQFSVEAKRAESPKINRQLVRALNKAANHTRVVFIDMNVPAIEPPQGVPTYIQRNFDLLRRFELLDPLGKRLPQAYVFLTNTPWEHHLDEVGWHCAALGDGFHIADFKADHEYPSLRAAIDSRLAHIEMHALLKSMRNHAGIPSTFDGDNPELAFEGVTNRLLIGNRYRFPDGRGAEVEGVLMSAVVLEADKVAWCVIAASDGLQRIGTVPLSDAELAAWKRHPDTFFGEISRGRHAPVQSPLDLYDFLMEVYAKTSKEKLLELMALAPDIEHLTMLDQPALASVHCERLAMAAAAQMGMQAKPDLQTRWRVSGNTDAETQDGPQA